MTILFLIGRVLFGGFFLLSAWSHFANSSGMAGYAASKGVPAAKLAVIGSGVLLLAGGLGVILGVYTSIALWAIIVFLVPTTLMLHAYWKETDLQARSTQQIMFKKNVALLGAALVMLMLPTPWMMSLFS